MRSSSLLVVAGLAVAAGCARGPVDGSPANADDKGPTTVAGKSAEEFLKWSMDRYAAMSTLEAHAKISTVANGESSPGTQDRELVYQGPNRFKVVSTAPNGFTQTAVSDGKRLVEFASAGKEGAKSYPAPPKISGAEGMFMHHPLFCGSILYQFFGGSANWANLVNADKGKVEFGKGEKAASGEAAQVVRFYGQQVYGHTEALIGKESGKVYRIVYDSEPLLERIKKVGELEISQMPAGQERDNLAKEMAAKIPKSFVTTEEYREVNPGAKIAPGAFDTTPPKGMKLANASAPADPTPIPLGKPAPDFTVTSLSGKGTKSLSSLRGKVVLIDFWATWCGPCKKGLPETQKLATLSAGKNFEILPVSWEKPDTISAFVKQNGYTMPIYMDAGEKMVGDYKVDPIPCTVIIDAKGILRTYLVGLYPPGKIREELRKAGAKL